MSVIVNIPYAQLPLKAEIEILHWIVNNCEKGTYRAITDDKSVITAIEFFIDEDALAFTLIYPCRPCDE